MASRAGNGSRKSRRGKRSSAIHSASSQVDAHTRELRALTAQLNRWVFYYAAQMPTLEHPTFVSSRKCRPGYTYTSLDVRPTKTEKGHSFGQRLSLPTPVSEFPKKKVNCVQLRLNPSPTFDSTVWVTLRKLPPGFNLASENVFPLFTDGKSAVLTYQHVQTGVQPRNKIVYDRACVGTEVCDIGDNASIYLLNNDVIDTDELTVHTDVEHERIPSASKLPV
uniref:Capsid protein n=1 Tax=Peanut stunt virus TaxID=12313 RepID=A0A0C4Y1T0_9BROM|nr:coat protein [Peanut stunt virus]